MSNVVLQVASFLGAWLAVGVGVCAAVIVVVADWRISLVSFALQATILGLLGSRVVPPGWSMLRMLVGGLVAIIWFISARGVRWGERAEPARWWRLRRGRGQRWPILSTSLPLRLLAVTLTGLVVLRLEAWTALPVLPADLAAVCIWLWLMGFLALALHDQPLHAGLGLLTMTGAVQLLVQGMTPRAVDIGLLAALDLLLGLAVAYLMIAAGLSGRPELARQVGVPAVYDSADEEGTS